MKNKILDAVKFLGAGKLIVYPTDTLYAIGCDATNAEAVEKVYAIKKRPRGMPLSILVSDFAMLRKYAKISKEQMKILKEKLPGPYTFILPSKIKLPVSENPSRTSSAGPSQAKLGLGNVGFRMIDIPIANQIVKKFGKPIAATSANIHGQPTAATITELKAVFGRYINLYMSGRRLAGKPSQVIDLTTGEILRN